MVSKLLSPFSLTTNGTTRPKRRMASSSRHFMARSIWLAFQPGDRIDSMGISTICIDHLSLGIGERRPFEPLTPGWVQEVHIPVLGLLRHQLHVDAVTLEMGETVRAEGMAQGPGVVVSAIPDIIEGRRLRQPGID